MYSRDYQSPQRVPSGHIKIGLHIKKKKKAPKTYWSDARMGVFRIQLLECEQVFGFTYAFDKLPSSPPPLPSVLPGRVGSGNLEVNLPCILWGAGRLVLQLPLQVCSQLLQGQTVVPALGRQVTPYSIANPWDPW